MSFNNKRAVLGGIMTTFIATIVIVVILIAFAVLSTVVKHSQDEKARISVPDEEKVGLKNILFYMEDLGNFDKLTKVRFLLNQGKSLEQAIEEAEYDK